MGRNKVDITTDERIIFELIINNEKVFPYLKNIIKLTSDFFYSESAKDMYNAIELLYARYQDVYGALRLANREIDKYICEFLLELKFKADPISLSWKKIDSITTQIDDKRILNDAIIGIELRKVEREIDEITQNQKDTKVIELENLMKITELNQRRIKLKDSLNLDN